MLGSTSVALVRKYLCTNAATRDFHHGLLTEQPVQVGVEGDDGSVIVTFDADLDWLLR